MLAQEEVITQSPHSRKFCTKKICWKSIFAGALVGFGLTFLLQLFDKAIGITIFSVNTSGAEAIVLGGFLGSIVGIIASMFFSGWIASYLSRSYFFDRRIGALYGLLVWCLTLLISLFFMNHMSFSSNETQNNSERPSESIVGMNTIQTAAIISSQSTEKPNSNLIGNKPIEKEGLSLYLSFILFFLGAVSACFGGYFGLKEEKERDFIPK